MKMLQFITDPYAPISAEDQALAALKGGCRWIEINMPNASFNELHDTIEKVRPQAEKEEAFLLITDHAEWAKELNVGGIHLTNNATSPSRARVLIGAAGVIGVNVHTYNDIEKLRNLDIDFVAINPFNDENNSLGLQGIKDIVEKMRNNDLEIAAVACGGVKPTDIPSLMKTGIDGVAISSAIAKSTDIEKTTREILEN